MAKEFKPQVVTANDLTEGDSVFSAPSAGCAISPRRGSR